MYYICSTIVSKYVMYGFQMGFSLFMLANSGFKNALVVDLSNEGEVLGTLQSTNSKLDGIAQITLGDKYAYLVSPLHDKIWYIDRKYLKA